MKTKSKKLKHKSTPVASPTTRGEILLWSRVPDKNNNTCFEAAGGSSDGESQDLWYRVSPVLRGDSIVWIETSSPELLISAAMEHRWFSARAAKDALSRWHACEKWEKRPRDVSDYRANKKKTNRLS